MIPAGGLVFSPDASAGCTCSYLNQSWIALQPDGIRPPSIEPAGAASPRPVEVRLTPDEPAGQTIHYTLDGSSPTKDSPRYTEPIRIASTAKLRARSFNLGSRPSNVTDADFVIDPGLLDLASSEWKVIDADGAKPASDWTINNGIIKQSSNVMLGGKRVMENTADVERPGSLFLYRGMKTPREGTISFEINSADDDGIGFVFGYQNAANYHLWSMHEQRPFRALTVRDDKGYRVLDVIKRGFIRRNWHKVEMRFDGPDIAMHASTAFAS